MAISSSRRDSTIISIIGALIFGSACAALWFRNLLTVSPNDYLWADSFDPNFLRWTAEWGYYALGQRHSWTLFWNAQIFYPHPNTLAYSDSLLTLQLFYTPLRWFGVPPLTALYLSLGSFAVGCFTLSIGLLRRLGLFTFVECLIIAFAAHFSLMMANFLSHYQLFGFHVAPPFFLALYLFLSRQQVRWLFLAEALYLMGTCFAAYLAPSLPVMSVGLLLAMTPSLVKEFEWVKWRRMIVPATLASVLCVVVLYLVQMKYYVQMLGETEPQSLLEIAVYAANPGTLFSGRSVNSYWWKPHGGAYSRHGQWESAYFPGFILLAGLIIGVIQLISSNREFLSAPMRRFCLAMLGVAAVAIVVSWGPFVDGQKAPFFVLAKIFPFLKNTRAIGRYGMFAALPLGVLTVVALRGILHGSRLANKASLASVMLLGALVVESLPTGSVFPYEEPLRSRYEKVATLIKPGDPFVELPCHDSGHLETIKRLMEQMNGALYHHGNLIVGYSGRSSPENATLIHLDQRLAAGTLTFGEMLRHLRQLNVKSVLINTDRYNANVTEQIVEATIRESGYKEAPLGISGARVLRRID